MTADTQLAFVPPASATPRQRWLRYSPTARIVIFVLAFAALALVLGAAFGATMRAIGMPLHGRPAMGTPVGVAAYLIGFVLPALLAYLFLVRVVERRAPRELAVRTLPARFSLGVLFGVVLFSAVVGVLWLASSYHVTGTNPHAHWLLALLSTGLGAGIGEEILFRGVLFRIVEEGLGTWWALLISALFFGFAHAGNPGATLWSSAAIMIEAGVLFGLLYHVTRSLPVCMGLHAAWNFCQGTVYGIPVSGLKADGWLVSTRSGPDWLSGGAFGAEASVVALTLCTLCSLALLIVALRRGSFVLPSWRRR